MDTISLLYSNTGFAIIHFDNVIMIFLGAIAIWLAIVKKYEPLLLLPIGF